MNKKIVIILIIWIAIHICVLAQYDFMFSGGIHLGSVGFDSANNLRDTSMKPGPTIGIEVLKGPIILGAAYVRRGGNWEVSSMGYSESISLDYVTGYVLFNIPIIKNISGLFGCQFGECMGGIFEYELNGDTGSATVFTDAFGIDFGLLFGIDYMLNSRFGTRVSYYSGLSGVFKSSAQYNFSNSGTSICLLLNI